MEAGMLLFDKGFMALFAANCSVHSSMKKERAAWLGASPKNLYFWWIDIDQVLGPVI